MADAIPSWRAALFDTVHKDKSIRTTTSIYEQAEYFIRKPAAALSISGPIV
jgi:hypothetical protein